MHLSIKGVASVSAIKPLVQWLVLLSVFALLLFGSGVSHTHAVSAPSGVQIAASVGDIYVGTY